MSRLSTAQLLALTVLIWGTTWHAILYQLAQASPEFGVTLRFLLAGAAVLALAAWRGDPLRLPLRAHGLLALQGLFMYGLSYVCVYHAEQHVPSGLVALGYSASPLLAGVGAWLLWRTALTGRFLAGGALGMAGVGLIFWPEIQSAGARGTATLGLAFTVAAVAMSAVGALAATRNRLFGIAFWPALGISMLYGALAAGVVWLAVQQPGLADARWPAAWSWWLSLLYLTAAGTVLAFAAFLTLQQRIGPGPAASVGVMTPVLALAVSTALEGYRPDLYTLLGAALALTGNVWMLRTRAATVSAAPAPAGTRDACRTIPPPVAPGDLPGGTGPGAPRRPHTEPIP
jgi:drug/metabolite transporter (DMT)-like permease